MCSFPQLVITHLEDFTERDSARPESEMVKSSLWDCASFRRGVQVHEPKLQGTRDTASRTHGFDVCLIHPDDRA